jgi:hypothetical protein
MCDPASGVPLSASRTEWSMASICEMPSGVAGSPSWVMIIRAARPSSERNIDSPRLNSALSNTSGGR